MPAPARPQPAGLRRLACRTAIWPIAAASLTLAAAFVCGDANAGAWPLEPGETLAILKYERAEADSYWDEDGERRPGLARVDETASLHLEHGLTARLTVQGKLAWSRGEEAGLAYQGRGPVETGLRYTAYQSPLGVVSLYVGVVLAGDGRNAGYAPPGVGDVGFEARLLAGRSVAVGEGSLFVEGQAARLARSGLPGETRLDLTVGYEPGGGWLLLFQSYGGVTDAQPAWLKVEASVVRRVGDWRVQAGWRGSAAGRASPVEDGPVIALWRRF